jgi:hypothetical protein
MSADVTRRLSLLSDEMARLRAEVAILREQLVFQAQVMDEARVRSLVAETPLAERAFHLAAGDHRRIERATLEAEQSLAELSADRDRLLDALSPLRTG